MSAYNEGPISSCAGGGMLLLIWCRAWRAVRKGGGVRSSRRTCYVGSITVCSLSPQREYLLQHLRIMHATYKLVWYYTGPARSTTSPLLVTRTRTRIRALAAAADDARSPHWTSHVPPRRPSRDTPISASPTSSGTALCAPVGAGERERRGGEARRGGGGRRRSRPGLWQRVARYESVSGGARECHRLLLLLILVAGGALSSGGLAMPSAEGETCLNITYADYRSETVSHLES